jgi:hypothetical protein
MRSVLLAFASLLAVASAFSQEKAATVLGERAVVMNAAEYIKGRTWICANPAQHPVIRAAPIFGWLSVSCEN